MLGDQGRGREEGEGDVEKVTQKIQALSPEEKVMSLMTDDRMHRLLHGGYKPAAYSCEFNTVSVDCNQE